MRRPLCMVCLVFICAVIVFTSIVPIYYVDLKQWEGKQITVIGQVFSKEKRIKDGQTSFIVYLNHIKFEENSSSDNPTQQSNQEQTQKNNQKIEGVLCYLEETSFLPPLGSYVCVSGTMRQVSAPTNPGEFNLRQYRKIQKLDFSIVGAKVTAVSREANPLKELLFSMKEKIGQQIDGCFRPEYAGLVKTIMLGDKSSLDTETKELYQRNGMIHILCISGLHISILGMGLFKLLRRVGIHQWVCSILCILFVILYGMMTGMGTSAFRAIFMFSMHLMAKQFGRTYDVLTAMCLAAVLLLIEQPLYVYHSGFLLSFASVTAISGCTPIFLEGIRKRKKPANQKLANQKLANLPESIATGLSIYIVTLPIYGLFYYEVPVYSVLLNLLILPLVTVLLFLALLACALGSFWGGAGMTIAFFDEVLFALFEWMFQVTEKLPMHTLIIGHTDRIRCFIYYILLAVLVWMAGKMKIRYRMAAIGLLCIFLFFRIQTGVSITVLDVGQGDGICIENRQGHGILIDCGSTDTKELAKYTLVPFLKYSGIHTIDAIFLTHLDKDHVSGICELLTSNEREKFHIKIIILAAAVPRDEAYAEFTALTNANQIPLLFMQTGDRYENKNLIFTCLYPSADYVPATGDRNAASLVLQMDYGDFNGIFTGDVDGGGEAQVLNVLKQNENGGNTDSGYKTDYEYLKVAHHGSDSSSSKEFLSYLQPYTATISCGAGNRYGHPSKQTMESLKVQKISWRRTDEGGAVVLWTDGKRMKIRGYIK